MEYLKKQSRSSIQPRSFVSAVRLRCARQSFSVKIPLSVNMTHGFLLRRLWRCVEYPSRSENRWPERGAMGHRCSGARYLVRMAGRTEDLQNARGTRTTHSAVRVGRRRLGGQSRPARRILASSFSTGSPGDRGALHCHWNAKQHMLRCPLHSSSPPTSHTISPFPAFNSVWWSD